MERRNSQWTGAEREYDTRRRELLSNLEFSAYVDDATLFMKRQRVTDFLTRTELFKRVRDVPGAIVECGVHKGGSLMLFHHLSAILEPYAVARRIIGFDTFEGFQSLSSNDPAGLSSKMFSDTSDNLIQSAIELADMNRAAGHVPRCEIVKGDATKTIPQYCTQHPELIIALLYLDFDIYEPTSVALMNLLPLVPRGGIVVFDELNTAKWAGETLAFKEAISVSAVKLERFYWDPWPCFFVVS